MNPIHPPSSSPQRAMPWVVGSAALVLGLLVYLVDRPAGPAAHGAGLAPPASHEWFGAVGAWLPSLVHALAFSLFTAALLPARPRWEAGACAFWFAVNAAFEIGQHPQLRGPLAAALREGIGQGPVASGLANYFLHGTFDIADLCAAALGAALAAVLLRRSRFQEELA